MPLLITFAGQGLQHAKMYRLLKTTSTGHDWLVQAGEKLNLDLFDDACVETACNDEISSQVLITVLEVGLFRELNLQNVLLAGYSLGEITALCASANLELADIILLVQQRAKLMHDAATLITNESSGLIALKGNLNLSTAQQLAKKHQCYLAIINADDHYIIGGFEKDLTLLIDSALQLGVKTAKSLRIHLPSHTPLLNSAREPFLKFLQQNFSKRTLTFPILNALQSEVVHDTTTLLPLLANELCQTLEWGRTMAIAHELGYPCAIELGPDASLQKMFLEVNPSLIAYCSEDFSTLDGLKNTAQKFT